jgi:hypothetical protein
MNQLTYNISLLVGTSAVSAGAGLQWGLGIGLMATGVLVIALTLVGAVLGRKAS